MPNSVRSIVRFTTSALGGYSALQLFTRGALRLRRAPTRRLRRCASALFLETPFIFNGTLPCRSGFNRCTLGLTCCLGARLPGCGGYGYGQLAPPCQSPECSADAPLMGVSKLMNHWQIQRFKYRLPRFAMVTPAPDRKLGIDLIPTVRNSFEEPPIVGVLTFNFVARQHIR